MWDLISILAGFGSRSSERRHRSGISYPRLTPYSHWELLYRKKQIMVDGDGVDQGNDAVVGEPVGVVGNTNGDEKAQKSVFQTLFWGSKKPLFRPSLGASRGPPWGQKWLPSAAKCSFLLPARAPKKSSEISPFPALPGGYRGAPGPILKSILGLPENCKKLHPSHAKRDSPTQRGACGERGTGCCWV